MPAKQHILPHDVEERLVVFARWLLEVKHRAPRTTQVYVRTLRCGFASHPKSNLTQILGHFAKRWWPNTVPVAQAALVAWATFNNDQAAVRALKDFPIPAKRERKSGPRYPMRPEQLEQLYVAVQGLPDPAGRNILSLILRTGRRCVDVLRIERKAIYACYREMQAGQVGGLHYVGKGGKQHSVAVRAPDGRDIIWSHLQVLYEIEKGKWRTLADLLAPRTSGRAQQEGSAATKLRQLLAEAAKDAKLEYGINEADGVYPHRVRRTFADTIATKVNGNPIEIMQAMGWSSIQTAQKYLDHPRDANVGNLLAAVGPQGR